ncbi:putative RNA-binding protein (DUF448 domain) [Arcobacter acticola]|uniref:Putative RNA-binding protein (DUF448 domain) n=1 Tax=Arcobacter acticola TaxID=1849015 RepID=A0A6M8EYX0_9BACT|nr:DUF448 domain-containing protein [Arcobacter acticola]QKE29747.1 putative RNA-binding protein (DUF448 domain) [Arcobacter acticola]
MANSKMILRTCVVCKGKFEQKELLRLKCEDKKLLFYNNYGRSFYICSDCENILQSDINGKDFKRIEKSLCKECKNKDKYVTQLKEMLTDVR